MNDPEVIHSQLENAKTIAVIGLSDNPDKPSHYVSAYMQQQGYKILPVNPSLTEVLGEPAYASLSDLVQAGIKPDLVNVFRVPSFIPAIVDEMLELGLRNLWVQQGIVNLEAAARAEEGGTRVVMDRCIMVEHRRANLS
ncbi:MAG TPA: CoA-binding protein [Granulicella sp.]|nr:CoA-binding protein [Granulicella sp.]